MSKVYMSEQELEEIFKSKFFKGGKTWGVAFYEWLDMKMEEGEIELVEFDHYEVSGLIKSIQ